MLGNLRVKDIGLINQQVNMSKNPEKEDFNLTYQVVAQVY
jgi:hypothetical protein